MVTTSVGHDLPRVTKLCKVLAVTALDQDGLKWLQWVQSPGVIKMDCEV